MGALPTGTVTFLFTDIEGSTQLWEKQPEAMKSALAKHDSLLRGIFEAHHGYVFKTVGDAFYVSFESADDALAACIESQQTLQKESWGETVIKVRMALHCGEVETRDKDYFGQPLNRVARLLSAGHGGQVLLSFAVKEKIAATLPDIVTLRDMGERRLKDLIRPEHIYQLVIENLPADFPPLKTLESFRTNLPAQLTSFIGREKEIADVKKLVGSNRLMTLTGVGGTGKTRLSLQVASTLLDDFPGGVWFIELASIINPELVIQTITATLQLQEISDRTPQETLTEFLQTRTVLLLLDNCEHLIHPCAQLATNLLQTCPKLKLIVTTREPLGITGETIWSVPSFSVPRNDRSLAPDALEHFDSIRLFVDRARAVQPNFNLDEYNARALVQICNRLDGIPLALELAAARVRSLSVDQIATRLDSRFRLLTGGSRSALPRQQTLSALIDWSYNLLSEAERLLFQRLAVFTGSFSLEAAEQVGSGEGIDELDVLDLVQRLVDKSMLVTEEQHSQTYYRLLETIRQYGREKLLSTDMAEQLNERHAHYYLYLAESVEDKLKGGPEQLDCLQNLVVTQSNLRTALEWLIETGQTAKALKIATSIEYFWFMRSEHYEARQWQKRLLALPDASHYPSLQAKALTWLGFHTWLQLNHREARPFVEQALASSRARNDKWNIAWALSVLTLIESDDGHLETMRAAGEESKALFRELCDEWGYAMTVLAKGESLRDLEQAYHLFLNIQNGFQQIVVLLNIGYLQIEASQLNEAASSLRKGLLLARQFGAKVETALLLSTCARLALDLHMPARSVTLHWASRSIFDSIGAWGHSSSRTDASLEERLAPIRNTLDAVTYKLAEDHGRTMNFTESIEYALQTE